MEVTLQFRLLNYAKRNNTVSGSSMILRWYERCKALLAVRRSGEQRLSTVGPTPRRRAGDMQTFPCTPSHFCHLRSLRGILCGFTAIISSKRLPHSVPKYNQHRVFLAQTVTEALGLISCKITFQLYCTYCCTIELYSRNTQMEKVSVELTGL